MPGLAKLIAECEGKILICGNGGLASESEHFAAELMGKFGEDVYIPCISLTVPSSLVTALANDIGYEDVFSHQIKTLGRPEDVLIVLTSGQPKKGHSENLLKAIDAANEVGMTSVLICGKNSDVVCQSSFVYQMPSREGGEIQEGIIKYLHQIALDSKRIRKQSK